MSRLASDGTGVLPPNFPSWPEKITPPESTATQRNTVAGGRVTLTVQLLIQFLKGFLELPGEKQVFIATGGYSSFRSREEQRERKGIHFSHSLFLYSFLEVPEEGTTHSQVHAVLYPWGPAALGAAGTQFVCVCVCVWMHTRV